MERLYNFIQFILIICIGSCASTLQAQNLPQARPGMAEGKFNYQNFTNPFSDNSSEVLQGNRGAEQDPELGLLFKEAPCRDCYELIGQRTEISKIFTRKGSNGKKILSQTGSGPMHYKDGDGRWHTIVSRLAPHGKGYYALHQPTPTGINAADKFATIGKEGQGFRFNNNLELLFERPDGTISSLGNADWTRLTAGDDGVFITDAWPGIDIEMHTIRGAIKTNFWLKHALPAYASGKLLVRDHLLLDKGMELDMHVASSYTGIIGVRNASGNKVFVISTATAFEQNNGEHTLRDLEYHLGVEQTLDIVVPGDFLNRAPGSYPVIIDPLVADSTAATVPGSSYSASWTVGCPTVNLARVPQDLTITDIQFSFEFQTSGGALLTNGALDFYLGACRNPATSTFYWYCPTATTGTCGGYDISLYSDFSSCVPAERCDTFDLNVTMNMYQSYASASPCSNLYITATQPYYITVVGETLDAHPIGVSGGSVICSGQSVTLTDTAVYGKPPYTYSWNPGGLTGASVTVSPTSTTTYTMVVTDSCGFQDTVTTTITVNPRQPITGSTNLCVGTSGNLYNTVGGGTWSSSTTSVATITASTGVVYAVGLGTTTITYTTPAGCVSTITVTVVASPSAITGSLTVCTGTVTTLGNAVGGGTWTSSNTSVATINSSTGVITGVSPGTTVIVYSLSASCVVSATVTVYPSPLITSTSSTDPTTCVSNDGSITLNGLSPGATYTVNYMLGGTPVSVPITANGSGQVIISSLGGGTYTNITVTVPASGCVSNTIAGPIVLNLPPAPATPTASNTSPVCSGNPVNFSASSTTAGVTYIWTGPAGFYSPVQYPTISSAGLANAGTYTVIATKLGCASAPATTIVVINPTPIIGGLSYTDPTTCLGTDGTVTFSGLLAGVSYSVVYTQGGSPVTVTITADASGDVVITGLPAGTYDGFQVSSLGCNSNVLGPVELKDPGAPSVPVVQSNSPVCAGATLTLFATSTGGTISWSWTGPNGFASTQQNPVIHAVTTAAAGTYSVTATSAACSSFNTITVSILPGVILIKVTPDQVVNYGSTIQLNSLGAEKYAWSPNDGSLSNPNINNPLATLFRKTTYEVIGMNQYGCRDTAYVNIDVLYDTIYIPTAFTPNGDGKNDEFRIVNPGKYRLVDFSIFNRWGELVYHNDWNIKQGWDGIFNGVPQDIGNYKYIIVVAVPEGENKVFKGDVTLIR